MLQCTSHMESKSNRIKTEQAEKGIIMVRITLQTVLTNMLPQTLDESQKTKKKKRKVLE